MDKDSMLFVGLDLGDRWSHLAVLDQEGQILEESRVPTTPEALRRRFSTLSHSRVAMEVGTHLRWVSQALQELGHEVLVANARKLRVIFDNRRKGDRADANTLARLARLDPKLLSPIEHRSPQVQADLTVLHSRDALVRTRTLLINHVRGVVKSTGVRISLCSANSFPSRAAPSVPESLRPALGPILDTIGALSLEIHGYDRQIEDLCGNNRRHRDLNPLFKRTLITLQSLGRLPAPAQPHSLNLGFDPASTKSGLAFVSGVSKNIPNLAGLPCSFPRVCRDSLLMQRPGNCQHRTAFVRVVMKNLAHDFRLFCDDLK